MPITKPNGIIKVTAMATRAGSSSGNNAGTRRGKTIAPTGKSFRLGMATIGHWKGGTMDHEWLFWDSQDFMKQLGLAN